MELLFFAQPQPMHHYRNIEGNLDRFAAFIE